MELNNNAPEEDAHLLDSSRQKRVSVSSGSSSNNSDTSEDVESFGNEKKTIEGAECSKNQEQPSMEADIKIARSLSDGPSEKLISEEFTEVFPSLPDSVLNKLGLLGGEDIRQRINEEELEQKFVALALAFTIDAATIKDRSQRQKRYRDQTENNLNTEIDRLVQKVTRIQPLCVDARTAELLTGLLAQIDVVIRASYHSAISAERYGAVQHEARLAEAVNLMISHVSLLKQQRDAVRQQLQYTKKVLQDTNSCEKLNSKRSDAPPNNSRLITRRRASIATIIQPVEITSKLSSTSTNGDVRRITRRPSDMSTKVSALARAARPSRLELGADLGKIKEGVVDNGIANNPSEEFDSDDDSSPLDDTERIEITLRHKITSHYNSFIQNVKKTYEYSIYNGSLHDVFTFAAVLCFIFSIIILGNMLIEIEFSKRGIKLGFSWSRLFSYLFNTTNYFQNTKPL